MLYSSQQLRERVEALRYRYSATVDETLLANCESFLQLLEKAEEEELSPWWRSGKSKSNGVKLYLSTKIDDLLKNYEKETK